MGKVRLIIQREIVSKLRNKTFIIMTFIAPLLIAGYFALILWISMSEKTDQKILVVDETGFFEDKLTGNDYISFTFYGKSLQKALDEFQTSDKTGVLYIPSNLVEGAGGATKIFYKKAPGFAAQTYIVSQLEKILYEFKLKANNIDPTIIHNAKQSVKLITEKLDEKGEAKQQSQELIGFFGFICGAIIFMFILMYGMMVFRSVLEEKTNRIVEILISSVKPFELMIGKIIGIAILGIAQFIVMGLVTFLLISILSVTALGGLNKDLAKFQAQQEQVFKQGTNINLEQLDKAQDKVKTFEILEKIQSLDFFEITVCFIIYFLLGYLFYSSILAAIASAVDAETDSQQFMLPVMIPMMAGFFIAAKLITNPDSSIGMWGSMIPFTSPIVMMARLPNGVPSWQIYISVAILAASFVGMVWLAGKIYRTGILMYGKKSSWKEMMKWVFYR